MDNENVQYLSREGKPSLAYIYHEGRGPLVVFCGGYASNMNGTKASYFEKVCLERKQAYLRFDYSGHGLSKGEFIDGTISSWAEDATDILNFVYGCHREHSHGEDTKHNGIILIGSSMGGWISLLLAKNKTHTLPLIGFIGIAAAPDFTIRLYEEYMSDDMRLELEEKGYVEQENDYSDIPYIFTKQLIEDGKNNLFLHQPNEINLPIHLFQGKMDKDVPWKTAEYIKDSVEENCVSIHYIEDGDHSLSRPEDLSLINDVIQKLS